VAGANSAQGSLDEAVLDGVPSRRAARTYADFGENRTQVRVNRSGAKAEPFGDLSVGQSGCDQLHDVHLAGRQLVRKRLFRDSNQERCCIVLYGAQHNSQGTEKRPALFELRGLLCQAVLDRVASRGAAVRNRQLAEDFPQVCVHGAAT
jgi:hypothetical protein